jgi:Flp pilus assembly protein TadD
MAQLIDDLVLRWKQNPSPATTVALCEALCDSPRLPLVEQVGELATRRHGGDLTVLLSVARMYIESQRLADAQTVLVAAGKQAPADPRVYRWLGEVLLRRGDADRAQRVFERAVQLGGKEPELRLWLERAKGLRSTQASHGEFAVAEEIAQSVDGRRPRADADGPTVIQRKLVNGEIQPLAPQAQYEQGEEPTWAPARPSRSSRPVPPQLPSFNGTIPPPIPPIPTAPPVPERIRASIPGRSSPLPPPPRTTSSAPPPPRLPPMRNGASTPPARNGASTPPRNGASAPPRERVTARPPRNGASAAHVSAIPPLRLPQPAPVVVPHTRDVLDALALSGVFEPEAAGPGATAWDRAAARPKRKGGPALIAGMVLFLAGGVGVYMAYRHARALAHVEAESILANVETTLRAAKPGTLDGAEKDLAHAFQLESRSPRAALDWTRERAIVGLVKSGADVAFEDAMARAKEVGVSEDRYAFARVASFLFQGDTAGAAAVLPRWDAQAASDPLYQVVAGATLERAGDARARQRYATAAQLDPQLVVADVGLVRTMALEGDAERAMASARAMRARLPERAEPVALVALAWGRDPMRDSAPLPSEVDEVGKRAVELPSGLRFVPHAVAALRALDRRAIEDARNEVRAGLAVADSPGAAVWLGTIALLLADEELARKGALGALQFSAVYEPARALAARVALYSGRLDEALKATEELDASSADVAVVRAAAAYERADADGLARAFDALSPATRRHPALAALSLAADVLAGRSGFDAAKLLNLSDDDAPWSDLVAMDAALDGGDLTTAGKIAAAWGKESEGKPLRALRLARLARYEGRLDAADALSQTTMERGSPTPRVLWERVFVLVARSRAAEVGALLARYPLVLGPVATWLSAYASASGGSADAAKGKTASLDPPPASSPLEVRIVAAAAFGAMKDRKRGADYVRGVLQTGSLDPDLVAAAQALGFRRVEHYRRRPTYE